MIIILTSMLVNGVDEDPTFNWKEEDQSVEAKPFEQDGGTNDNIDRRYTPVQLWRLFFDDQLMCRKFFGGLITKTILKVFFCSVMSSAFFNLSWINSYWKTEFYYIQAVNSKISKDQFKFLLANMHFSTPTAVPPVSTGPCRKKVAVTTNNNYPAKSLCSRSATSSRHP
ncbi:hypothetical protein PPL_06610 [Heterostelium album PN500]|uniref:PiggyBac transposable element-derived protein domain-containing protein n=1 Tax=Heterostelium pallidum (strain ATCC 26659 / Pp 5 / PN500) TaxID=670386 RepID=D3BF77_HETP5|nr:hypothetical protein PPL_06610 [Heterostelium album PN500]EFA79791.1 hypothetical protein PPL_06610 [Heterostelium album PN500]|eukprot:XP_020431912.1 hypothetical protein PPL_06610 [Heterostelium album PN500]